MSDKTVVPGMETPYQGNGYGNPGMNPNPRPEYYQPAPPQPNFYGGDPNGTVVPGMGGAQNPQFAPQAAPASNPTTGNGKPILGFLYSISRVPTGEFWPLYQGSNTIGRDASCDICLPEATVSRQHVSIVIRKNKNPEKTIAAVKDLGSTEGTMLNGTSLDFSAEECHSGDKILVGQAYELLFILIDTNAYDLKPAEVFTPVNVAPVQRQQTPQFGAQSVPDINATVPPSFRPEAAPASNPYPSMPYDGTVGLDGSDGFSRGGTTV